MRCIIAGSRGYHGSTVGLIVRAVAASGFESEITEVISGCAKGIDLLGEIWAKSRKIKVTRFEADWDGLGKRAGYVRNQQMAEYAAQDPDGSLIAIYDGSSPGTRSMIDLARKYELRVWIGHPKESHGKNPS